MPPRETKDAAREPSLRFIVPSSFANMSLLNFLSHVAAAFCSPPVHLLCFSTLAGTQLYQTFLVTKVTFQTLPKTAFVGLQKRLFPIYFAVQAALLLLTALTFPPRGILSLAENKHDVIPLLVAGGTAFVNLTIFGPKTRRAMLDLFSPSTLICDMIAQTTCPLTFRSTCRQS